MKELKLNDVMMMIKVVQSNYPNYYKDMKQEDVKLLCNTWHYRLKKFPIDIVREAFYKTLDVSKFPPTLADIMEQIENMRFTMEKSDQELWAELENVIYKASDLVSSFNYTAIPLGETRTQGQIAKDNLKALFDNLDPILKQYVPNIQQLISLSYVDDLSYEKGRFIKAIPNLRQRDRLNKETDPKLLKMLDNCVKSLNKPQLKSNLN